MLPAPLCRRRERARPDAPQTPSRVSGSWERPQQELVYSPLSLPASAVLLFHFRLVTVTSVTPPARQALRPKRVAAALLCTPHRGCSASALHVAP